MVTFRSRRRRLGPSLPGVASAVGIVVVTALVATPARAETAPWQGTLSVTNLQGLGIPVGSLRATLTIEPVGAAPSDGVYAASLDYAWSYDTVVGTDPCFVTIRHTGGGTDVPAGVVLQPGAAPETPEVNRWLIDFRPAGSSSLQEFVQIVDDTCGGPTDPAPLPSGGLEFTETHVYGPPSDGTETEIAGLLPDFDDNHLYAVTADLSRATEPPPPTNHVPSAVNGSFVAPANEGGTSVTLRATDVDDDPLTYDVTQPGHGVVTLSGDVATYTPDPGYAGADSFTFTASDGKAESPPATMSIDVDTRPVASSVCASGSPKKTLSVTLAGEDPDGDPLQYQLRSTPLHGVLTGTAPLLTYTPFSGFKGDDAFTFGVSDGRLESLASTADGGTVTIHVTGPCPNNRKRFH
jgi:hypothetical protein